GTAGAGAHPRRGLDHGADDLGMLAHAEIVVRAPDHDVLRTIRCMPDRVREAAGDALEIGKDAIAPLGVQPRQGTGKIITVIHEFLASRGRTCPQPGTLSRGVPGRLSRRSWG